MDKTSDNRRRKYWFGGKWSEGQDAAFEAALDTTQWELGSADDWDAYWFTGMPEPRVFKALEPGKSVNHIPGNNGLTVKSLLYQSLLKARKRLEGHKLAERFDFFPRGYSMPEDYFDLQEAADKKPDKLWIQKPKGLSRGRGIQVLEDAALAPKGEDWMVQEYLHRPHLYNGHKYVLRCYVVVRSVDPLRVYWYKEGFAKLASEPYSTDPGSLKNLFVHLTNPDVNEENEEAPASVVFIPFSKYRQWLRDQGHDDQRIFQDLEDLIVLTMMSARERMRQRIETTGVDSDGCYELFGLDCMVDADLKPWILECNLSPSLDVCSGPEDGGIDEARIKRQLVVDLVSMIGANEERPDWSALNFDERIKAEWDWEKSRIGDYRCVFPGEDPSRYLTSFPVPRYSDLVLAEYVAGALAPEIELAPNEVEEFVSGDALALYARTVHQFFVPNETAAFIWLQLAEGLKPSQIIDHLAAQAPIPKHQIARDVWDTLADWGQKGLVRLADQHPQKSPKQADYEDQWVGEVPVQTGAGAYLIQYTHDPVGRRLALLVGETPSNAGADEGKKISIVKGAQGYTILRDARIIASDVRLSRIAPLLTDEFLKDESEHCSEHIVLRAGLIACDQANYLIIGRGAGALLAVLAKRCGGHQIAGAVALDSAAAGLRPLPIPVWVPDTFVADADCRSALDLSDTLHEATLGHPVRHLAARGAGDRQSLVIDRIIIAELGEKEDATVVEIGASDVLPELWAQKVGTTGDPAQLVAWVGGLPVHRVRFSDPHAAVDLL